MDWRQKLSDYAAAVAFEQRTSGLVTELETRLNSGTCPSEEAAISTGVAFARRRACLAKRRLAAATWALTQGRNVIEVMWSAPDDL